ncbi:uncharacterized protein LOC134254878 [Saccostrea cucullata]|uniref:uncharacterized protein LOC134254878 n=1 Tax=Saccostrea cuccullata TaxID=36930 RepID=UPI002ED4C215
MATFNDPLGQVQDVKRCQLCPGKDRKSAAETCCNSCQVNLCKICVGNHVISDPDMKHDVVTFKFKKSEVIPPQCSFHDEEKCDKFCEQCDSPFCLKCLNSGAHKSHNVQSISEIYKSRQDKITKDNLELETEIAPVYDAILSEIETMTSNVLQQHEDRTQSIKNLGEKCHRLVENVIRRYANVLKERYSQDNKNLLTLKSEFQRLQSLIQSAIDENKSILFSMDSSKLIHYISRNEDFINIPPTFELTVPNFTPVEITEQVLFKMIGEIPETIKSNIQGEVIRVVQPIVQVHSRKPDKNFIDEPQVIRTITLGNGKNYRIECIPNTNEFFIFCESQAIYHMNIEGKILDSIYSGPRKMPLDLAVTKEKYLVYINSWIQCIILRKSNKEQSLISLHNWNPLAICFTSTGELLVAMRSAYPYNDHGHCKVVRYSGSSAVQEIQYVNGDEFLYGSPRFIEENKNFDIVVSDSVPDQVVVVDKMGKLRFKYKGNFPSKSKFTPCGITTDSLCHILIADLSEHVIHIIDRNGYFLLYISNCQLQEPYDLSIDSNDNLFVAELGTGKVKKIKLFE